MNPSSNAASSNHVLHLAVGSKEKKDMRNEEGGLT